MPKLYTLRRRGFLNREVKNYKAAIKDFSSAIEIRDTDMDLFYYRGLSYAGLYNYKLALRDFIKAKKLGKSEMNSIIEECERFL
jgi:tetratricopeptide (TPR) repeat protein